MNETRITQSVDYIRRHCASSPRIAIVLGSGLGDFANDLPNRIAIPTSDIPHYPVPTVEGHSGKLVFATLNTKPILAFQGRIHFYESANLDTVLYPVYVAHRLGITSLIITNAAGSVNGRLSPGDLMLIADQINFTFHRVVTRLAVPRKPIYSPALIAKAEEAASADGILVRKGVYAGLKGPSYETAAEIRMLSRIGADAVGMSTVFESSCAAALGIEVLGISCITNLGTGIGKTKLSHEEVTEVGNNVKETFARLIKGTIALMA